MISATIGQARLLGHCQIYGCRNQFFNEHDHQPAISAQSVKLRIGDTEAIICKQHAKKLCGKLNELGICKKEWEEAV